MRRIFIPSSEWLYFKIYTGRKSADDILINTLYPFCSKLINSNLTDQFFFIRYSDPDFHIRLRLHVETASNIGPIFKEFYDVITPYVQDGIIWNVQCDTYKREIERYGHDGIIDAESIFFIDSEAILNLLDKLLESSNPEQNRWMISLILIDDILDAYNFSSEEKNVFMKMLSNAYKEEFGFTSNKLTKQLNDKYRNWRQDIYETISHKKNNVYSEILTWRLEKIGAIGSYYKEKIISKEDFVRSLIHMSMNRLFKSKNRQFEMVIYEFLYKYYNSELAKMKYTK